MKVGILGAGHIAQKMAQTLVTMSERANDQSEKELAYAVASRSLEKASQFARQYGIEKAYGSYEEMVADPLVDLVYVATPHSFHFQHVKLALNAGKNVLCEKSFMMNAAQAQEVIGLARSKGLLLAEAMWVRYMPFSRTIKELVDGGVLGKAVSLSCSLGYPVMHKERLLLPELGGGALLDLGVYTIHFARMIFGGDIRNIQSVSVMHESGVDAQNSITLEYEDGRLACLHSTALAANDHCCIINGTQACMVVDNINNPQHAAVYDRNHNLLGEYHAPEQITGFEYQVLACKKAIENSWVEVPELPHQEIAAVMRIIDSVKH